MLTDFKNFLMRGNIVELAVAFVIGLAFAAVVNSLVSDLIMPIIAMIIGKPDFSNLTFTIHHAVFRYGNFITNVITFVAIAAGCSSSSSSRCGRWRHGGRWASPRSYRTRSAATRSCSRLCARRTDARTRWGRQRAVPTSCRSGPIRSAGCGESATTPAEMLVGRD